VDTAFLWLLAQPDEEETDLVVLFQLHLLPIVGEWTAI